MTRPLSRRARISLTPSAKDVLVGGIDFFNEFTDPGGPARLQEVWRRYESVLLAECLARDPTVRPCAWWWWSRLCPTKLRIEYPKKLGKTEQRTVLPKENILTGAAVEEARKRVRLQRTSGTPSLFWDRKNP